MKKHFIPYIAIIILFDTILKWCRVYKKEQLEE